MITIHIERDGFRSVETNDDYHGALPILEWIECAKYYKGNKPPNFPVPALPTKMDILTGPFAGVELSIHGWLVYIYHSVENVGEYFPFPNPKEQEEFIEWMEK